MKKLIKNISYLLLVVSLLPILSGCNNEDDVIQIFTGKTWKLSFIALEGTNEQYDYWKGDATARTKSMEALAQEGNFVLNFEGTDLEGKPRGTFKGRAILASISGEWSANGKSNELLLNSKPSQSESDILGKAFVFGLQNAFKYEGDNNNLFIYYKEGQTIKRLGLKPKK